MDIYQKKLFLENTIKNLGSLAVAFSSGVDSTYLLKTAHNLLGDNVVAITASGCCFPQSETEEAKSFCEKEGIRQIIVDFDPLEVEEFKNNNKQRCYFCKKALFAEIKKAADKCGIKSIADGTNFDDINDYRPGMKATQELKIISPLMTAELTKEEIRFLSKEEGLSTFVKPSYACLASRIPYGESITSEKLKRIEKSEEKLRSLGFTQLRVRSHNNLARIEIEKDDFLKLLMYSDEISSYLKSLGFDFVSLDLEGYKTGKMNI